MIQFDEQIFQMGWFNRQLVKDKKEIQWFFWRWFRTNRLEWYESFLRGGEEHDKHKSLWRSFLLRREKRVKKNFPKQAHSNTTRDFLSKDVEK